MFFLNTSYILITKVFKEVFNMKHANKETHQDFFDFFDSIISFEKKNLSDKKILGYYVLKAETYETLRKKYEDLAWNLYDFYVALEDASEPIKIEDDSNSESSSEPDFFDEYIKETAASEAAEQLEHELVSIKTLDEDLEK